MIRRSEPIPLGSRIRYSIQKISQCHLWQQRLGFPRCLQCQFPAIIMENIVGHCDIALTRKTDPGQAFNWQYFRQCLRITEKKQPLL